MPQRFRGKLEKQRAEKAVQELCEGNCSYRHAEKVYHIPKSTLHDRVYRLNNPLPKQPRTALTVEEEEIVVGTLLHYSKYGAPLTRLHLKEVVSGFITSLPKERHEKLPFRNKVPGYKWLLSFEKRYSNQIKFVHPTKQELKRYSATNGENLTTHISALRQLIEVYNLDDKRIWNCDETGATPDKESNGRTKSLRYMGVYGIRDAKLSEFRNTHRVTMLPAVSAAGDVSCPLFVFKGKEIPWRQVLRNGQKYHETYHELLPRGALISMREEVGAVDSRNFLNWAEHFIDSVKYLTKDGSNRVVVYALPAHASGKTQPLDVVVYGAFKTALRERLIASADAHQLETFTTYEFCGMLRSAFNTSFTRENIVSSFNRAGIYPWNPMKLLSTPKPTTGENVVQIMSVSELVQMLETKLSERRNHVRGDDCSVLRNGFLNTTKGAVLTSTRALELVRHKADQTLRKERLQDLKVAKRELRKTQKRDVLRKAANKFRTERLVRRANLANMSVEKYSKLMVPMDEKRAREKLMVKEKRAVIGVLALTSSPSA